MKRVEFQPNNRPLQSERAAVNVAKSRPLNGTIQSLHKHSLAVPASSYRVPTLVLWAFILFAFTIPFEAAEVFFAQRGSLTLARVIGITLFASCFLFPNKCLPLPHRAIWWMLGYFILYLLHGIFIPDNLLGAFRGHLFPLVQGLVIFWLAMGLLKDEKCAKGVLLSFAIASILMALGALLGVPGFSANTIEGTTERLTVAEGINPNYTAYITGIAAVVLVGFMLNKNFQRLWRKVLLISMTLPLFVTTVNTGSRTGIAGLLLGLSIYLLPLGRSRRQLTAVIWGTLAAATVVYIITSNSISSSRWERSYYQGNSRFEIWQVAVGVIADRPIFGWGAVANEVELGKRMDRHSRSPHNFFLHLFLVGGIVGAGAFLVGLWLCVWEAWRARAGSMGLLPLALMVTVIVNNLAQPWLSRRPTWLVFGLALAAALIRPRKTYILRISKRVPIR